MENRKVLEAIALRKILKASYNRGVVRLAPHILYTRHGEIYVDAITFDRDGAKPREVKLGAFKVAGLKDVAVEDAHFVPDPLFDPADPKYAGVTLLAVEAGPAEAV